MPLSFEVIDPVRFAQDAPDSTDLFESMVNNENYLFQQNLSPSDTNGAPTVINGSFEVDAVATVQPFGWVFTPGTGGSGSVSDASQNHGGQAYAIVRDATAGHSGGSLVSEYMNVSPDQAYDFIFMRRATRTDVSNTITVTWYDNTKSVISSVTVLTEIASLTSWQTVKVPVTPASNAVFAKITISGGTTTTVPAAPATIYFDGLSFSKRAIFQEMTQYGATGSNNFTVPAGVFQVEVVGIGRAAINSNSVGYVQTVLQTIPGTIIAFSINSNLLGNSTMTYTGPDGTVTMTVRNNQSSTVSACNNPRGALIIDHVMMNMMGSTNPIFSLKY